MSKPKKGKPRGRNGGRPVTTGTLRPPPVSFRLTVEDQARLDAVARDLGVKPRAAARIATLEWLARRETKT